jgi:hypothetical protein
MSSEKNNNFENIKKTVKYAQEHAAGLTLIATISITVGGVLLKYIYYLIELAYVNYFNISPSYINVADDNIMYGIVATGVMFLLLASIRSAPYWVWQSEARTSRKVIKIVFITLIPAILLALSLIMLAIQGVIYSVGQYGVTLLKGIIFGVIVFSLGFFLLFCKNINKKGKRENAPTKKSLFERVKGAIILFLILFALESVVIYVRGYLKVASQNEFKIIETTQELPCVILYETDSSYIIAECEITDDNINIYQTEQKQITKENIEYSVRKLTQIVE